MRNRYDEKVEQMPRIVYPNDILPDENSLTEMSREAQVNVVRNIDGRIGRDENR
jgi:hypothetical protein